VCYQTRPDQSLRQILRISKWYSSMTQLHWTYPKHLMCLSNLLFNSFNSSISILLNLGWFRSLSHAWIGVNSSSDKGILFESSSNRSISVADACHDCWLERMCCSRGTGLWCSKVALTIRECPLIPLPEPAEAVVGVICSKHGLSRLVAESRISNYTLRRITNVDRKTLNLPQNKLDSSSSLIKLANSFPGGLVYH
jgi:hypothetical protein